MDVLQKYENKFFMIKGWFLVVFMSYLVMSRTILFVTLITERVNAMIFIVFGLVTMILIMCELLINYKKYKTLQNILLLVFVVACGISTLVNYDLGMMNNIKTLIWTLFQVTILFMFFTEGDRAKSFMTKIMHSTNVIWFIAVLISLVQFFLQIHYRVLIDNHSRRQGIIESRLFGIFSDPNYAAVTSIIVIFFTLYLLKKVENKLIKVFMIINIVFQFIYIILSGSRTGYISFALSIFVYSLLFYRNKLIKADTSHFVINVLLRAVLITVATSFLLLCSEPVFSKVANVTKMVRPVFGLEVEEEDVSLVRDDTEDDVSNNRFDIWKGAIEASSDARIFGVSPRNLVQYATKYHPGGFIATSKYETHNTYLSILVCGGIVATIPFIAFIVYLCMLLIRYFKEHRNKNLDLYFVMELGIVMAVAISMFFYMDVIFTNTCSATITWLCLGGLFNAIKPRKVIEKN